MPACGNIYKHEILIELNDGFCPNCEGTKYKLAARDRSEEMSENIGKLIIFALTTAYGMEAREEISHKHYYPSPYYPQYGATETTKRALEVAFKLLYGKEPTSYVSDESLMNGLRQSATTAQQFYRHT